MNWEVTIFKKYHKKEIVMYSHRKRLTAIRKKKKGKAGDIPSRLLKQKEHERENSFIRPKNKKAASAK